MSFFLLLFYIYYCIIYVVTSLYRIQGGITLFFKALYKIFKRKKINGYYNSDYIISHKEKESLLIGLSIIFVPIVITIIIISFN